MVILAVDDEKMALNLLMDEIKNTGRNAEVVGFLFPMEALSYAQHNNIDVAFLDVEMPQINGIELAKELKKINPLMKVIFTTAYREYAYEAFTVRASGYILKPVSLEDIKRELDNLDGENVVPTGKRSGIEAVTFGSFDILVNGNPVMFKRSRSKEILAYLIDRQGSGVTKKEIASVLFEDEEYSRKVQDYVNKMLRDMSLSLKEAGASNILRKQRNYYAVNTDAFKCDLYDYENGIPEAMNNFRGEYMSQYSWAEETLGRLINNT